jgi:hypothetical protein
METITEIRALQNFADNFKCTVHEKFTQDKRNTVKKYFLSKEGVSISPVFDYDQLNCFMCGLKSSDKVNALKEENERLKEALQEITDMALQWSVKEITPTIFKCQQLLSTVKEVGNNE